MRPTHPFGDIVTRLRARKHGLTQSRLAELAGYDPAVIARMCQGQKDLTGLQGRERVVRVLQALDEADVLYGLDEANSALDAANMPPLFAGNAAEAALIQQLARHHRAEPDNELTQPGPPRHNLPAQLTSFIGRADEISQVEQFLGEPIPAAPGHGAQPRVRSHARLITLTGPGGVGKTRLALEVASALYETGLGQTLADGVWWVPFGSLAEPSLVVQALIDTFELTRQTRKPPLSVLVSYFEHRRLLLVLDNCEHLVEACADLVDHLMRYCPNLRILATSREALQVPGEVTLRVPPLMAPRPATAESVFLADKDSVLEFDAVRLFVERAQAMRPEFDLTAANTAAVAHICDRLDGIPLALELAAALMQVLSVDEIAARIDNRFALLKGGYRTATPRHQALSNAIDWSYELLTPVEQVLLARLSVFAGAWDTEAAESICADRTPSDAHGLTRQEIWPALRQLVGKSLVVIDQNRAEHTRYRLLKTIHEYATAKLRERKEYHVLKDNHLNYLVDLAETAGAQLGTRQHKAARERLVEQHAELQPALAHAEQGGHAEAPLRLTAALQMYWMMRGVPEEGLKWLTKALDQKGAVDPKWRIAAMFGWVLTETRDHKMLEAIVPEAQRLLEAFRAEQNQLGIAHSLSILGVHAEEILKNPDRMRECAQEALTIFEALAHTHGIPMMRAWLGRTLKDDPLALDRWLAGSIELYKAAGNTMYVAMTLAWQAEIAMRVHKDIARGRKLMSQSLEVAQAIGDPWMSMCDYLAFGQYEMKYGERSQAAVYFAQGLDVACQIDVAGGIFASLGLVCILDSARALASIQGYLQGKQQAGDKLGIAAGTYFLGMVMQDGDSHDYEQARQLFEQSLQMWRESGHIVADYGCVARNLLDLGLTYHFLGNNPRAIECFDECLRLAGEAQHTLYLSDACMYRGFVNLGMRHLDQAERDFQSSRGHLAPWQELDPYLLMAGLGEAAWRSGWVDIGAKLMGYAAAKEVDIRKLGRHTWCAPYLRLIAATRERLSEPYFAAAWAEGEKLRVDEAEALLCR